LAAKPSAPRAPASPSGRPPRILLIEDDEFQRIAIVTQMLTHRISNVHAAASGEDALELLKDPRNAFDITLCDLRLSESDGIAFLLAADPARLGAIVLHSILPSDVQQATVSLLRQRGIQVAACIPKPLNMPSFFDILRGVAKGPEPPAGEAEPGDDGFQFTKEDIQSGLDSGRFIAHFQPLVDLDSHSLHAIECLGRWDHPAYGLLSPQFFLPHVLEHGLIDAFTWQVMDYSLGCMGRWPKSLELPEIGINVSASSLRTNDFVDEWKTRVARAGIPPEKMVLELTETEVAPDDSALLEILTKLRILGFGIALDDFGVGHTSLNQLRQLPITELKIDRSFVSRIGSSRRGIVLLDAIIYMANELSLSSVAEGIETAADAELLKELGCKIGQGYYFARPMPEDKLHYWIRGNA